MENFFSFFGIDVQPLLEKTFLGNPIEKLFWALLVFLSIFVGIKIFKKFILKKFENFAAKTETKLDNHVIKILEEISEFFYIFLAFFITFKTLNLNQEFEKILDAICIFLAIFEIGKVVNSVINFVFENTNKKNATTFAGIKLILRIGIWSLGFLLILSNLGFDISALVASMGIGGIAVALAAQNILGDLFASFTIYFDKPFKVGDYIVIGNDKGIVKKIGLKTTRIETLLGNELVVSNKELTEIRVQNFKRMRRRRGDFSFGVTYDTPIKKLKKIPEIVKNIINNEEHAELLRAHFSVFGDSSLNFDIAFYVDTQDYDVFMDIQQNINLKILEAFEKEKIEMAFPTRTVYMQKT